MTDQQLFNTLCLYYLILVIVGKQTALSLSESTRHVLKQKLSEKFYRPKTSLVLLRLLTLGLEQLAKLDMHSFFTSIVIRDSLFQVQEYFEKLRVVFDTELIESHFSEELRPANVIRALSDE